MNKQSRQYKTYEMLLNRAFEKEILELKLNEKDEYLELFSLAILPEYRNRGIGSAILEDIIDFALKHGYDGIQLQVDHKTRKKLQPFYERFGFKSVDEELEDLMRLNFDGE